MITLEVAKVRSGFSMAMSATYRQSVGLPYVEIRFDKFAGRHYHIQGQAYFQTVLEAIEDYTVETHRERPSELLHRFEILQAALETGSWKVDEGTPDEFEALLTEAINEIS